MPQIEWISGELSGTKEEKPQKWIEFSARRIGKDFVVVEKSAERIEQIASSELSKEAAFMRLDEGDRDSVRKGWKELVLRKQGWILRECINKASEEIHISLPDRTVQIKDAKNSALARATKKIEVLKQFKEILRKNIEGDEMYFVSFENEEDKEEILGLINSLSIGIDEVEVLKGENEKLRKLLGDRSK